MRIIKLIYIAGLLFSCSIKTKPKEIKPISEKGLQENISSQEIKNDSILYIDQVGYFPDTKEFYVDLSFSKPFSDDIFKILSEQTDSVIYEDEETSRRRLPMQIAKDAFNLSQLDHIKIYNTHHKFISNAKLKRIEYYDELNSYFIAVFTSESKVPGNEDTYYCLGNAEVNLKKTTWKHIENKKLTEKLEKELAINPVYVWKVQHIEIQPYNSVYSIYACDQVNGGTISYLTEYKNGEITVLQKYKQEIAFYDFYPVPIEKNGKPVLLINIVLPDSDAVDEFIVGAFNGSEFILENNNRLSLK